MTFIEDPNEQYFTELQATTRDFKKYFLNNSTESLSEYINITTKLAKEICSQIQTQDKPFSGKSPFLLRKMANSVDYFAENGLTFDELFEKTRELILENHISVYHPHCVAHLHCPTFIISLAAEMIISAFNQSMDSFDQAPAATMIEQAFGESLLRAAARCQTLWVCCWHETTILKKTFIGIFRKKDCRQKHLDSEFFVRNIHILRWHNLPQFWVWAKTP
jgi:hypothetical protein